MAHQKDIITENLEVLVCKGLISGFEIERKECDLRLTPTKLYIHLFRGQDKPPQTMVLYDAKEHKINPHRFARDVEVFIREVEKAEHQVSHKQSKSILKEEDVEWIVNDIGELGVRIHGQCFFLHKGCSME